MRLPFLVGWDCRIGDTKEGRNVLDVTYSKFDDRLFGVGLHRGVLFMEMIRAAQVSVVHCVTKVSLMAVHCLLFQRTGVGA